MPSIESIDKLKSQIQNLADEPAIREQMGVPMENITPPESGLDPGLSELLGGMPIASDSALSDMDSFLGARTAGGDEVFADGMPQEDLMDIFNDVPDEPPGGTLDDLFAPDEGALDRLREQGPGDSGEDVDDILGSGDSSETFDEGGDFDLDEALGDLALSSDEMDRIQEGLPPDPLADSGIAPVPDDDSFSPPSDTPSLDTPEEGPDEIPEPEGLEEPAAFVDAFDDEDPLAGFGALGDTDELGEEDEPSSNLPEDDFDDLPEPDENFGLEEGFSSGAEDLADLGEDLGALDPAEENPLESFGGEDSNLDPLGELSLGEPSEPTEETALEEGSMSFGDESSDPLEEGAMSFGEENSEALEEGAMSFGEDPAALEPLGENLEPLEGFSLEEESSLEEVPEAEPVRSTTGVSADDLDDEFFNTPGEQLVNLRAGGELSQDVEDPWGDGDGGDALEALDLDDGGAVEPLEDGDDFQEADEFIFGDEGLEVDLPELRGMAQDSESIGDGDEEPDEFSLDDFQSHFGVGDEDLSDESEYMNPANLIQGQEEEEISLNINDEEFLALQRNLSLFPLNLRIAVEETIGEKVVPREDLSALIRMLITGASPKAVARKVSEILGKKITIPPGYEKGTGKKVEARKDNLLLALGRTVAPILKFFIPFTVLAALVTYLGMSFVYQPIRAGGLYEEGLELVSQGQFVPGEEKFSQAYALWPDDNWFFTYADEYQRLGNYRGARTKYRQLLRPIQGADVDEWSPADGGQPPRLMVQNYNKQGLLDWSRLEANTGFYPGFPGENYRKANRILAPIFARNQYDREALLTQGDNYFDWSRDRTDSQNEALEGANLSYSTVLNQYGLIPPIVYRFIEYFMFTDRPNEVMRYRDLILEYPDYEIRPRVVGKMGGYLIDLFQEESGGRFSGENTGRYLEDITGLMMRAVDEDPSEPIPHYQLARYNRIVGEIGEEKKALNAARHYFEQLSAEEYQDTFLLSSRIDNLNRMGELFLSDGEESTAQQYFQEALRRYEDGRDRGVLEPNPTMGRVYSNLGNLHYYQANDWYQALLYLEDAESMGHSSSQNQFRRGVIRYQLGQYEESLDEFFKVEHQQELRENNNLLWSVANALMQSENYQVAEGYYTILEENLQRQRESIDIMNIETREDHRGLMEFIQKTLNNLGVSIFLGRGNANILSPAAGETFEALSKAETIADALGRNQSDFTTTLGTANELPKINIRSLSEGTAQVEIYPDLPLDLSQIRFAPQDPGPFENPEI